jgi:hypothetical protein
MSTKTLFALSTSALLMVIAAPGTALAQFAPPLGPPPALAGPPPGLGAGGPPPGLGVGGTPFRGPPAGPAGFPGRGPAGPAPRDLAGGPPRLGSAEGPQGIDRGGRPDFRGVEGRAAAYSANSYTRNNDTSYGDGHGYRYGAYAAAAAAAYGYGSSYAASEDGCYYVSTYRRSRRVLVCPDN